MTDFLVTTVSHASALVQRPAPLEARSVSKRPAAEPAPDRAAMRLVWPDVIKALALAWIFLNHLAERLFGDPYIANPTSDWPPLAQRVAQLRPLAGHGVWDLPLNLLRYVGWTGDQGVNLFLILSGFGLTWGLLHRQTGPRLDFGDFYRGRAKRIYPLWWATHIAFLLVSLAVGTGLSLRDPAFYLSMAGIRATPRLLYYFAPAWWYVGLLIQLYLVYPVLWYGLRRRGPLWLLLVSSALAFAARGSGLLLLPSGVDAWARGAIFITRLPEFVLGMSFAAWLYRSSERGGARLRTLATVLLALACYALGTVLSLTLLGMTIAPFLLGGSAFVLLYLMLRGVDRQGSTQPWVWMGQHSYALFLVHQPMIGYFVPRGADGSLFRIIGGTLVAVLLTIAMSSGLERSVDVASRVFQRGRQGLARAGLVVGAIGAVLLSLLIGAELVIRALDPQEGLGWGERASLEPHPTFGWRLKPAQLTHLRWESYDYHVQANALGFPGPEYPTAKSPGAFRILTTGDAFTSAERDDTDNAWPRLLEADLTARLPGRRIEVLNFAVTGYGPNQYAAVAQQFVPLYRPDLIIIGFFVNDYEDALTSITEFRDSIGFDRAPQQGWGAVLRLAQLRSFLKLRVAEPLYELVRGEPAPHRYFLGQFAALERDRTDLAVHGREQVTHRLRTIKQLADDVGARLLLAMIPAPVQICGPQDLAYYPRHVDLRDATRFDLDQPQRVTREIAAALGVGYFDLAPALRAAPAGCPYQPRNLHWTAAGHRVAADTLANYLITNGNLGAPAEKPDGAP